MHQGKILPDNPWLKHKTRDVYQDAWIHLELDTVTCPDGKLGTYSVVRLKGGVGIVAIDNDGRFCIVGQYRYAPGTYSWEIPKGAFPDFGSTENPLSTAKRELVEETGLNANKWTPLGMIHTLMGSSDDKVYLFVAEDLEKTESCPDSTELITVEMIDLRKFREMLHESYITDATSIAAVFMALDQNFLKSQS